MLGNMEKGKRHIGYIILFAINITHVQLQINTSTKYI